MKDNIIMRHKIIISIRNYLNESGFLDIETPFLTKSTPEGARDFLVPSRVSRGRFYALPQSPQIFKQLLMISGFEKYYQIVRCFRDEDLRADRQPEFTQIDIEVSFITKEYIFSFIDGMFKRILEDCYGKTVDIPIKKFDYETVMELYGTDRPDLRFELKIINLNDFSDLKPKEFIHEGLKKDKHLYGLLIPDTDKVTRKTLENYSKLSKEVEIDIFTWLKSNNNVISGPLAKLFEKDVREKISIYTKDKNYILIAVYGKKSKVLPFLGKIRVEMADILNIIDTDKLEFCWITDFPLFEWNNDEQRLVSVHHPFTSPEEDNIVKIKREPLKAKSKSYDFIVNGVELGGGSIRIHRSEVQKEIFSILGLTNDEIEKKFGFLLNALDYGAPPHGGIAFGLDRIVMILQGEDSIRDVIPFPKTSSGTCPLTGAPDYAANNQLSELGIILDKGSD